MSAARKKRLQCRCVATTSAAAVRPTRHCWDVTESSRLHTPSIWEAVPQLKCVLNSVICLRGCPRHGRRHEGNLGGKACTKQDSLATRL